MDHIGQKSRSIPSGRSECISVFNSPAFAFVLSRLPVPFHFPKTSMLQGLGRSWSSMNPLPWSIPSLCACLGMVAVKKLSLFKCPSSNPSLGLPDWGYLRTQFHAHTTSVRFWVYREFLGECLSPKENIWVSVGCQGNQELLKTVFSGL